MQSILDKKIPSLLGIAIIVSVIAATTFLVKGTQIIQTNAGPGEDPKNIQITNISDSSFTVTYITDESVVGKVNQGVSPDTLDRIFLDDRDKTSQKINTYQTHSITVNSLLPNSTYYFTITSGGKTISNNGMPFNVKTGPVISSQTSSGAKFSGNVKNTDGISPTDGLIVIKINGAQPFSSLLQQDGRFNILFNNLRSDDLNSNFKINNNSVINSKIFSSGNSSSISILGSNLSVKPVITLSNNYDFTNNEINPSKIINSNNVKFPQFKSKLKIQSNTKASPSGILTPTKIPANIPVL